MPSTKTYLEVTNAVLRAVSSPRASATAFSSPDGQPNSREIRQAKEIVAEVYAELMNDRPDSFWQRTTEIRVYAPFTEGGVVGIPTATPTMVDFAFDGALDLDDVPWIPPGAPSPAQGTMFHIAAERQYYRVLTRVSATRLETMSANVAHVGYNDPSHPLPYAIFRVLTPLPADFRDVLNVYNPYVGADLRPMGPERAVEEIVNGLSLMTTAAFGEDPEIYGIFRPDAGGAPQLVVLPIPASDRVLSVRYLATATAPVDPSDVFDLDEDLMSWFMNRCKARASLEIMHNTDEAQLYERWAKRDQDNAQQKSMEAGAEFQRIMPATGSDYRSHYRDTPATRERRRIYLRR